MLQDRTAQDRMTKRRAAAPLELITNCKTWQRIENYQHEMLFVLLVAQENIFYANYLLQRPERERERPGAEKGKKDPGTT